MNNINFDFKNCKYVVTGASSGMGRQVTLELAKAHAKVLAIGRNQEHLSQIQSLYPDNIVVASVDVCHYQELQSAIQYFVSQNGKLHGFVHAAGISGLTPFRNFDMHLAREIFEVNYWAGISLIQICTKNAYSNHLASGVIFASAGAYEAPKGKFCYASSKSAILTAVKVAAKEVCNKGIRLNTVSPGWVNTEMTQSENNIVNSDEIREKHLLGIGNPEDVSGVILFLLSDRSKWITGEDFIVDGGYLT